MQRQLDDISNFPNPAALEDVSLFDVAGDLLKYASLPIFFAPEILRTKKTGTAPHFQFHKLREGSKDAVIVINGFLSMEARDTADWEAAIARRFGRATWYHLDWEACQHPITELRKLFSLPGLFGAASGSRAPNALSSWHTAMSSAERAGILLADAITSTPDWRFTLAGHSLGARVIHFALKELANRSCRRIQNVYLLGGAVGGGAKDDGCWATATEAVNGKIYNCFSGNDTVLQMAYQGANAMLSEPIGYSGISLRHPDIVPYDASRYVDGHGAWKRNFGIILEDFHGRPNAR
jgi:hypothetical protein